MERRMRLRDFLRFHLDAKDVPGLVWEDRAAETFRVPWKHANRRGNDFVRDRDTLLPRLWAINTMKFDPDSEQAEDPTRWKTNLRCSLNSLKATIVREKTGDQHHIYRFAGGPGRRTRLRQGSDAASSADGQVAGTLMNMESDLLQAARVGGITAASFQPHEGIMASAMSGLSASSGNVDTFSQALHSYPAASTDLGDLALALGGGMSSVEAELELELSSSLQSPNLDEQLAVGSPCDVTTLLNEMSTCGSVNFSLSDSVLVSSAVSSLPSQLVASSTSAAKTTRPDHLAITTPSHKEFSRELPDAHELHLQVSYRGYAVAACNVGEPRGCHLHYGQVAAPTPKQLCEGGVGVSSSSSSTTEPLPPFHLGQLQQLCLPVVQDTDRRFKWPQLRHALRNFTPGLTLEMKGGRLRVRRLCAARVFCSPRQSGEGSIDLRRYEETKIFDGEAFKTDFQDFRSGAAVASPSSRVFFSVGQPLSPGNFSDRLMTVTVTVCRAEAMVENCKARAWQQGAGRHVLVDEPDVEW